jgi:hypothetical protein
MIATPTASRGEAISFQRPGPRMAGDKFEAMHDGRLDPLCDAIRCLPSLHLSCRISADAVTERKTIKGECICRSKARQSTRKRKKIKDNRGESEMSGLKGHYNMSSPNSRNTKEER